MMTRMTFSSLRYPQYTLHVYHTSLNNLYVPTIHRAFNISTFVTRIRYFYENASPPNLESKRKCCLHAERKGDDMNYCVGVKGVHVLFVGVSVKCKNHFLSLELNSTMVHKTKSKETTTCVNKF